MAFVAAATTVGATVLGTGAAAGIGSTLVGGALIGAGIGGAYSALTGDGNILNSMLTGGLIGGAGAGLGSAFGLGAKAGATGAGLTPAAAASAPSTLAAPTANVVTGVTPAMQAAANLEAAAVAEGATTAGMVPAANTGLAANTVLPASMQFTPPVQQAAAGLTGKQLLGYGLAGSAALSLLGGMNQKKIPAQPQSPSYIRPYTYSSTQTPATGQYPSPYATTEYDFAGNPVTDSRERNYFDQDYTAQPVYQAAAGGLMAIGGPVERMSSKDMSTGMYPMGMLDRTYYATPTQRPASMEIIKSDYDTPVNPMTGLPPMGMAMGGDVEYNLGGYSDGGRLLKGPGDGVSDDIPAMIGKKQPARLADGEFVIPARIVSEIGNGSTDAGAKRLYAMMDRVQAKRQKSAKKGKFAINTKAEKDLPA
jgi:hypothetical protein